MAASESDKTQTLQVLSESFPDNNSNMLNHVHTQTYLSGKYTMPSGCHKKKGLGGSLDVVKS